jgi:hypothetical protein
LPPVNKQTVRGVEGEESTDPKRDLDRKTPARAATTEVAEVVLCAEEKAGK